MRIIARNHARGVSSLKWENECGGWGRRTDAERPHARALGVDLVDVGHASRERVGRNLVAVLVAEVCRLGARPHDLCARVGCIQEHGEASKQADMLGGTYRSVRS